MHDNPVALVTGANKGIGLQIAKDLTACANESGVVFFQVCFYSCEE